MQDEINLLHSKIKEQEILIKALKDQEKILRKTILFYENRKVLCLSNS